MLDIEKLIEEVKKRPPLYDTNLTKHKYRDLKVSLWEEVFMELYPNWLTLPAEERSKIRRSIQTKWKSLRDQFLKEYKKYQIAKTSKNKEFLKKRKYIYYDNLSFLISTIKSKRLFTFVNAEEDSVNDGSNRDSDSEPLATTFASEKRIKQDEDSNDVKYSVLDISNRTEHSTSVPSRSHNRKSNESTASNVLGEAETQREDRDSDVMGNKAFLMSLLPFMNKMSEEVSMDVRLQIMQIIRNTQNPF